MSRVRANEIEALRRAAEQYRELAQVVAQICRENPRGLLIRPLFGQPRAFRRAA